MIKLPKTVEFTVYVHVRQDGSAMACTSDMSEYGYAVVSVHDMTLDVPQDDPTPKFIEGLEAQAEKIQASAAEAVADVMDKIQQLKCIEHNPAEQDDES
jgi:hypothetical protein